jgi:6-phosphogluconolactonase (cycloisomerase 2 family)
MTLRSLRLGACLLVLVTNLGATRVHAVVDVVQVVRDEADGLGSAWAVAVSPDGLDVYVASFYEDTVAMFRRDLATGEYRYRGKLVDGVNGIDGLDGAAAIAVSPNGYAVYVAGQNESALAVFDRAPSTGSLALRQVLRDDEGLTDGLATPTGIAVLSDGSYAGRVYVSSYGDAALSVFDPSSEGLDFVAVYKNGVGGVEGLLGARAVVAANGDFGPQVYVASQSDAAVAVFATDFLFDFDEVQVLRDGQGGVDGLSLAQDVALSPDGNQLYVAGQGDDAVAVFLRSASTGELLFNEVQKDGLFGVDGLDGVESVLMTPDGDHVYAASPFEPAVATFAFDAFDDGLDYLTRVLQDPYPIPFLSLIHLNLAVLPDSTQLLVSNSFEGTLSVFDRNFSDGALTLDSTLHDGSGVRAMRGAQSVVASPDGDHVYAMGSEGSLISAFARDAASGVLSLLSTSGGYGEDPRANAPTYRRAAMSHDGLFLYEARFRDDAIASYQRDAATGALTASAGVTSGGVPDLFRPTDVAVSPDGTSLYSIGGLQPNGSMLAFARDVGTGALTHQQTLRQGVDGVSGLGFPQAIAVSPDGQFVYVASRGSEGIAVFRRLLDGHLEFVISYFDSPDPGDVFDGIDFASAIAISPDGHFVYVFGTELVWMQRSAATGELSLPQRIAAGATGPCELAIDAAHLYLATYNDNGAARHSALLAYDRDPTTGALTLLEEKSDLTGTDSVDGAVSVALSPNARSVYVAGYQDDAVTVFTPEPGAGSSALAALAMLALRAQRRRAARFASR